MSHATKCLSVVCPSETITPVSHSHFARTVHSKSERERGLRHRPLARRAGRLSAELHPLALFKVEPPVTRAVDGGGRHPGPLAQRHRGRQQTRSGLSEWALSLPSASCSFRAVVSLPEPRICQCMIG
ncbi:unnamed protein product [Arctogadus glacialis]